MSGLDTGVVRIEPPTGGKANREFLVKPIDGRAVANSGERRARSDPRLGPEAPVQE